LAITASMELNDLGIKIFGAIIDVNGRSTTVSNVSAKIFSTVSED